MLVSLKKLLRSQRWLNRLRQLSIYTNSHNWKQRIADVIQCPDNESIPRVKLAGQIVDGSQIMHNGLKINLGSYYGEGVTQMLTANRGVHEPQEERVFQEVLRHLPSQAVMMELGAYWAFYSLWFHQVIEYPTCIVCEPSTENLLYGKQNFELNQMEAKFVQCFSGEGDHTSPSDVPILSVDSLMQQFEIETLHILHTDIQGSEVSMLKGASKNLLNRNIEFIFISTHSRDLHRDCIEILRGFEYRIITDINMFHTYAFDGLIVAQTPNQPLVNVQYSKRGWFRD